MTFTKEEIRSAFCSGYLNGWNEGFEHTTRRSVQDGYDLADMYIEELEYHKEKENDNSY